ncbi:hypothetical protein PC118_g18825 [Phytophthora cactorum]|uniref:Uncharacterized protein n=1 Tax=Phytophthora cactorum TaxID=29920 RepID=A0A8T1FA69_9STRA|nr:hypothetical protein PC118_g18825 [Phytophthora cactorum]
MQDSKQLKGMCSGGRMQHNKMFAFFFLIVISCALGLICVASLIQQRDLQLQRLAVRSLHGANEHDANGLRGQMELMQQPAEDDNAADDLSNFECVGWKARRDCSPDGGPDPPNDRACNGTVHNGESGYCEIRHKVTGEVHQVMKMHCNSLRPDVAFKCEEFATFLGYGRKATEYVHDKTFSMENCRKELVDDQLAAAATANEKPKVAEGDRVDKIRRGNIFCGVTMVQHDPERGVVFLHRNQEKLSSENREKVWAHIQEFRMDEVGLDEYDVRGANGGRYFPKFKRCYGKDIYYEKAFTVKAMNELPFAGLEQRLLNFVQEAARIDGTVDEQANVIQGEDVVDVADPAHQ